MTDRWGEERGRHGAAEPAPAPRWRLSAAQTAAVLSGIVIVGVGLLFARADIVVLGAPVLAASAWAWDRRPRSASGDAVRGDEPVAVDGVRLSTEPIPQAGGIRYRFELDVPDGVEAVHLRYRPLGTGGRLVAVAAHPGRTLVLSGTAPVLHSGPQRVVDVEYRLLGTGGAFITDRSTPLIAERVVPPPFTALDTLPLPHRLTGLTGSHDSARPGDGGDFRDIDAFRPGDRLRRIDWKATARLARSPGDLFVRRTHALADATVFVIVDTSDDVGADVSGWSRFDPYGSGTTSLDLARQAASAIAAGYLRGGDRVAFADLGAPRRFVPPGAGPRHLDRLLRTAAATAATGPGLARRRPPQLTPGALAYVLSTFLDAHAANSALQLAAAGHRVVAVDVLPPPGTSALTADRRVAHRLLMLERATRMSRLQSGGVELLRWSAGAAAGPRDVSLAAEASADGSRAAQLVAILRTRQGSRR